MFKYRKSWVSRHKCLKKPTSYIHHIKNPPLYGSLYTMYWCLAFFECICSYCNCWPKQRSCHCKLFGRSGGVVAKLLAYGARGPGFDSRSRRYYDFRDWLSPAFKSRRGPGFDSRSRRCDFRDWLSPAFQSRYDWYLPKAMYIFKQ